MYRSLHSSRASRTSRPGTPAPKGRVERKPTAAAPAPRAAASSTAAGWPVGSTVGRSTPARPPEANSSESTLVPTAPAAIADTGVQPARTTADATAEMATRATTAGTAPRTGNAATADTGAHPEPTTAGTAPRAGSVATANTGA